MNENEENNLELSKNEYILLLIISRGETYGLALKEKIERASHGVFSIRTSAIYKTLKGLESRAFVKSRSLDGDLAGNDYRWRIYYQITDLGKEVLIENTRFYYFLEHGVCLKQYFCFSLGQLLREAKLLTARQVDDALKFQKTQPKNLRFGDIIVDRGWLKRETVEFFAALQFG